jgi:hypothetical protein
VNDPTIEGQTATPTDSPVEISKISSDGDTTTATSDSSAATLTISNSRVASIPGAFAAFLAAVWMMA